MKAAITRPDQAQVILIGEQDLGLRFPAWSNATAQKLARPGATVPGASHRNEYTRP